MLLPLLLTQVVGVLYQLPCRGESSWKYTEFQAVYSFFRSWQRVCQPNEA